MYFNFILLHGNPNLKSKNHEKPNNHSTAMPTY